MTLTTHPPTENRLCNDMQPKISALLIGQEDSQPLFEALESCRVDVLLARDCNEARRIIENRRPVQVLLIDRTLRDQDWMGTLEIMAQLPAHVQVIVCCRQGDHKHLIAAMKLGAYDVLLEPYEPEDIQRIVEDAAAKSDLRSLGHAELRSPHTLWVRPLTSCRGR